MYATLYIVKDLKKIPQLFPWRRVRGISRHILEKKKKKNFTLLEQSFSLFLILYNKSCQIFKYSIQSVTKYKSPLFTAFAKLNLNSKCGAGMQLKYFPLHNFSAVHKLTTTRTQCATQHPRYLRLGQVQSKAPKTKMQKKKNFERNIGKSKQEMISNFMNSSQPTISWHSCIHSY